MGHKVSEVEIAQALAAGEKHTAIARRLGVATSTVYRAETRARKATPAEEFAASRPSARQANARTTFSELGTTGLRRFGGRIDDEYDRAFKDLHQRLALYREMADDPIVAATDQATRMVIRRVAWSVQPGGESAADAQAAEFLQQSMDDMALSWADVIDNILVMFRNGFQLAELVYKRRLGPDREPASKYDDGRIGWRKWTFIDGASLDRGEPWIIDDNGGLQGARQTPFNTGQPVEIPISKLILFRTTTEKNNPEGRSLYRAMHRPWYYANNLQEVEAISKERSGAGFPVLYLGDDVSKGTGADGDLETLKDMLRNIRIDDQMGALLPWAKMGSGAREGQGALLEFGSNGGKDVDFHIPITRYEQRMAMVALAQFIHLGMSQVGARSLGESSQDFFTLAVSGWVDAITDTLNRFAVEPLFKLNYFPGLTVLPTIMHEAVAQTNILEIADYIAKLVTAGTLTPDPALEANLRELADLPENPDLDKIYKQKAEQRALGLEGQKAALEQAKQPPEPVDQGRGQPASDDASIRELRRAVDVLERTEQFSGEVEIDDVKAEQFFARLETLLARTPGAAPNLPFNLTLKEGTVQLPEGFGQPAAPPVVNVTVDTAPMAQAVERIGAASNAQAERFAEAASAEAQRPIVVNVAAAEVNVPPANITVLPAPVHVAPQTMSVDLAPVAAAIREVGQYEETIEIEHAPDRSKTTATKRRRKKGV